MSGSPPACARPSPRSTARSPHSTRSSCPCRWCATWSASCTARLPDFAVWGIVVPNLTWSNIAREVLMDAGVAADDPGLLDRHGLLDQHDRRHRGGRHDRRRRAAISRWSAASRAEPDPARAGPVAVRLAAQVPAGALARPEGRRTSTNLKLARHPALHPGDQQPHDRHEHGRAHRDHRQGVEDRPRGAGRARARQPPARGRGWERGFFDDLVIPIGDSRRDTIPRSDTSLERAREAAAHFRSHQRARHADRRQFVAADRRRRESLGRVVEGPRQAAARHSPSAGSSIGRSRRSICARRDC